MLTPRTRLLPLLLLVSMLGPLLHAPAQVSRPAGAAPLDAPEVFRDLLAADRERASSALDRIEARWQVAFAPMLVDALRVLAGTGKSFAIIDLLQRKTRQGFGRDIGAWWDWIWQQKIAPHPRYGDVKALLYERIDPRFGKYFGDARALTVRLDEVRWGGVVQDGIPPLRRPRMLPAKKADYLADGDVVFGIEVNGDVRAYPKRILAWHEMFTDKVGGLEVCGVY